MALKNNDELKLEVAGLERANEVGDIYRPFSLGRFAIAGEIATPEEVQRLKYPYGTVSKGWRYLRAKLFRQNNKFFKASVLNWTGDIFLDGYWQSPLYFNDIRDTLLTDFTLKDGFSKAGAEYATLMQRTKSVSLHVRRGDYVKNPTVLKEFGLCSPAYYTRAIEQVEARI